MRKELYDEQTRLARRFPASTKTEGKVHTTKFVSRKVESDQGGLMSNVATRFFLLSSWFFLDPLTPFDALFRIRGFQRFEFRELIPATACVNFIPSCFSYVRCTAHCYQQCVRANLANRASHISCNIFFRGVMTPSLMPVRPGL